jgi:hypothetical protein
MALKPNWCGGGFFTIIIPLKAGGACLAASFHFGTRDIAFLVDKIQVSLFSLNAAFCYLLWAAAFFLAPRHLSTRDIAFLVYVIEVALLSFDAQLRYFLRHVLIHLLPLLFLISNKMV